MNAIVHKTSASNAHRNHDGAASCAVLKLNPAGETIHLQGEQHARLHDAAGWAVRALAGTVWITQDGDIRDIVLETGETFVLDRNSPALISPLSDARISVTRDCVRSVPRAERAAVVSLAAVRPSFA